jgi:LuxR family transcriptional regulator, maltose regulon positive regulatory protein
MARSRLHVPETPGCYLDRARLTALLGDSAAPLVLLSAPAGSGKTALAVEWAHRLPGARDVVWVSCHGGSADPWADVVRGTQAQAHDVGVPAPRGPEPRGGRRSRIEQLIELADRAERPWTVFLDGYEIRSPEAAQELDQLLRYAGDSLQVVLTTRSDPVLPLHRYRLDGTLLEVRAADLAFTDEEARDLLLDAGIDLDPGDLRSLNDRLAGWAAGLRFAVPMLAGHPAQHALVSSAVTYNGNINAYLVEEVLDQQPTELRGLILATCVPDVLTPGLLEQLTGEPAAPTTLRLRRSNVFLESVPADESCLWYMPFFRDLARAQFAYEAPERFRIAHRSAAAWFVTHGDWQKAARHLAHAGEPLDCAELLVDHLLVGRLLCEGRGESYRRLTRSWSPAAAPRASDHLLGAALALAAGDGQGCSRQLAAVRDVEPLPARVVATMAAIEAVLACGGPDVEDVERLAASAEEVLVRERRASDPGADDTQAVLDLARARAGLRLGPPDQTVRLFEVALTSSAASWSAAYRCVCLCHASVLHARAGDVAVAEQEAEEALGITRLGAPTTAWATASDLATAAHLARACAAVAEGDLDVAHAQLAEAGAHPEPLWQVVGSVVSAVLAGSAGAAEEARAALVSAETAATEVGAWAGDWVTDVGTRLRRTGPAEALVQGPREGPGRQEAVAVGQRSRARCVTGTDGRLVEPLTAREEEVLAAMSEWLTTEEIAEKLFVSVNTVRTHVRNILTKLGVSRRNAAIREAMRLGLLPSGPPVAMIPSGVGSP